MDEDERLPRATVVVPPIVQVHFDGACEPPRGGGVATYGFTVEGEGLDYEECDLAVRPWSKHATNNVAEYVAAIRALEYLRSREFRGSVLLFGDSQLVIRQMTGEYEVKAEHLKAYHERLSTLAAEFAEVRFRWVPREENRRADELSKAAFDAAGPSARRRPSDAEIADPDESDDP
jgi:ribonuclease HI